MSEIINFDEDPKNQDWIKVVAHMRLIQKKTDRGREAFNRLLMEIIKDRLSYLPHYGIRKMTAYLRMLGLVVNHKHVERLMRQIKMKAN